MEQSAKHRRRVLVVDDNLDHARTMIDVLRHMGHEVRAALNGCAALAEARMFRPEYVLLDLGLPDADGLDVARELRTDPDTKGARIIAITARPREHEAAARAAGIDHYMVKPASLAHLGALLT